MKSHELICGVAVPLVACVIAACGQNELSTTLTPAWASRDDNWAQAKAELQSFGERYSTSWDLYLALRDSAQGGPPLTWDALSQPGRDWTGLFTRTRGATQFDPDLPPRANADSAQLTPAGAATVAAKRERLNAKGGEYDPLSDCRPAGTPRWFTEPTLNEFIVTPGQTWLINEMANDIRRVYTDGREHTADIDAYPSWNGDSVGFWDGEVLVAHTKHLMAGQYQRGVQPDYSDQVTLVERWRKVDDSTLEADVWVFDPVNLAKPWYTRQSYMKLDNSEYPLRIRYWNCHENANNEIVSTDEGTSQFADFDFDEDDAPPETGTARPAQTP